MKIIEWQNELTRDGTQVNLAGIPIAMHCHHYNINLLRMLEQTLGQEGIELLFRSAEESAYRGFNAFLEKYPKIRTLKSKIELAATIYQNCGLGILHIQRLTPKGGDILCPSSHHVTGWLAKHGKRETPGCHFTRGWIAGLMEALFQLPLGHYEVTEQTCKMKRDPVCHFIVRGL